MSKPNLEKIIEAWERCRVCNMSLFATPEGRKAYLNCEYTIGKYCGNDKLVVETIELLKEYKNRKFKYCPSCGELVKWE